MPVKRNFLIFGIVLVIGITVIMYYANMPTYLGIERTYPVNDNITKITENDLTHYPSLQKALDLADSSFRPEFNHGDTESLKISNWEGRAILSRLNPDANILQIILGHQFSVTLTYNDKFYYLVMGFSYNPPLLA